MPRLNYVNEAVGAVVLIALVLLVIALVQSSRVQRWFDPGQRVKVLLPEEGLFGLSTGADVEILGTHAGKIERIVIDPTQRIHAIARIRSDMLAFVRNDSTAVIRKRFGVAGDAYLEITRGHGDEVDWEYAVITARPDRAPTETLQVVLDEIREQAVPAIADARQALDNWNALAERLREPEGDLAQLIHRARQISEQVQQGRGTVGRFVQSDVLAVDLEQLAGQLNETITRLGPTLDQVEQTVTNLADVTGSLAEQSQALPEITDQTRRTLVALRAVLADLQQTTPNLPRIAQNIGDVSDEMPALILEAQQTLRESQQLLRQLQSHWLFGGGGEAPEPSPYSGRLSPLEARP
jgi:phospholipid/cholesterol/gamma-HCH transport system substrate-binding protein